MMRIATIGEKSIPPVRGRMERIGARIGSVTPRMNSTIGLRLDGLTNHDRIARAKISSSTSDSS